MKRIIVLAAVALLGVACGDASNPTPRVESGVVGGGYDSGSKSGSGSSDDYPAYDGSDLDCPDIGHPVRVDGADPHGLDSDGDGIGCEIW
jgi:hypothetical protein